MGRVPEIEIPFADLLHLKLIRLLILVPGVTSCKPEPIKFIFPEPFDDSVIVPPVLLKVLLQLRVPTPAPAAILIIPPDWVKLFVFIMPVPPVVSRISDDTPVEIKENVPFICMVIPPIFGLVVRFGVFHVKFENVTTADDVPLGHEPAIGDISPVMEHSDPVCHSANGIGLIFIPLQVALWLKMPVASNFKLAADVLVVVLKPDIPALIKVPDTIVNPFVVARVVLSLKVTVTPVGITVLELLPLKLAAPPEAMVRLLLKVTVPVRLELRRKFMERLSFAV